MENQQVKAENEAFFVEEVKNESGRIHELQDRLHVLQEILEPYSIQLPKESEGQVGKEQASETEMDEALYYLRNAIDDTESMINTLIENFNG